MVHVSHAIRETSSLSNFMKNQRGVVFSHSTICYLIPGFKYLVWDLGVRHLLILAWTILFLVLKRELRTVSPETYIEKNVLSLSTMELAIFL